MIASTLFFTASASILSSAVAAPILAPPLSFLNTSSAILNSTTVNSTFTNSSVYWYRASEAMNACGNSTNVTSLDIGLPLENYTDPSKPSSLCGLTVILVNPVNNLTMAARVADASGMNKTISLAEATWKTIVNGSDVEPTSISWRFANATEAALIASNSSSLVAPQAESKPDTPSKPTAASPSPVKATVWTAPTSSSNSGSKKSGNQSSNSGSGSSGSSSSGGSGSYSGHATYFTQGGNAGACGSVHSDSDYIVALQTEMYAGGSHCGQQVKIYANGRSITATVADECPTCGGSSDLDLSEGAFYGLNPGGDGLYGITWSFA